MLVRGEAPACTEGMEFTGTHGISTQAKGNKLILGRRSGQARETLRVTASTKAQKEGHVWLRDQGW